MKVISDLKGTVTEGRPAVSGGVVGLHDEPVPGFIRQARLAVEGVTLFARDAEVHVPMAELWKLAEQVDERFRAPEGKPAHSGPGPAIRAKAAELRRKLPK